MSENQLQERPPPETISVSDVTTEAQDFAVADYTLIQLTNLEKGGLYGIYPIERNSRASGTQKADNPSLITTNAGTRLFKAESDTAQFYGSEVGISNTGHVKILKYSPEENAAINTAVDTPLYFDEVEQSYVYEKYSVVKTTEFTDKKIALLFYHLSKEGGARMSTDYGIIDTSTGSLSHDAEYRGVFDVSDKDAIEIFNQIRLKEGGEVVSEVLVQNPVQLSSKDNPIKNKQLYEIKASDWTGQTVVMELELEQGVDIFDLFLSNSATDIRYTNGYRHPYFFPSNWNEEENTVVIYIGEIDKDIIFDISANKELGEGQTIGTATLRPINNEDEKPHVISVEPGPTEPIKIKADDFFTPVIFEGGTSIAGMNVQYECETEQADDYKALFVEGHTSGLGFSQYQLNDGENRDERMGSDIYNYLEYMVIRNPGQKAGTVKLTFSNSDSFKDVQRLKTGTPADFSLDQDYLYYFSGNNVILQIKLDANVEFSPQLVDELSNFSYRSSDLNLCFTPVHYDSDSKTLYVDAGMTTGPVVFFVRSWEENEEPRKIGKITVVENEPDQDWLPDANVENLRQGKSVEVSAELKNSPYMAYRVTWTGNEPPTEWQFDFSGPEGSFVRGQTYSLSGEYLGTLSATWEKPVGSIKGGVITRLLFVNTQFSNEQENAELKLTISKPE